MEKRIELEPYMPDDPERGRSLYVRAVSACPESLLKTKSPAVV